MNEPSHQAFEIIIRVDPKTGRMNIAAPINDKILCVRMLADAMKAILDAKVVPSILSPSGGNGGN